MFNTRTFLSVLKKDKYKDIVVMRRRKKVSDDELNFVFFRRKMKRKTYMFFSLLVHGKSELKEIIQHSPFSFRRNG